jgi:hypothetical protein
VTSAARRPIALPHAAAVAAAFAGLAAWSWRRWPDVLVDFGRDLYLAWRLSEGDVLYRDVASVYGPLSPYLNALWFRVFGTGLLTLAIANMAILAAVAAGLYTLLRRAGGGSTGGALAGTLVFLATSGFAHLIASGGFNFVTPYAHEATHGFALGVGAVLCALRGLQARPARWFAASGALAGLAFLTKPEPFVAAAGTCAVLLALARHRSPAPRATFVAFAGSLAVAPAAAFALLATAMPPADAWTGTLGSWAFAGNEEVRRFPYFAWTMGLDAPGRNLAALAAAAWPQALFLAVLLAAALLARRVRRQTPLAVGSAVATLLVLAPAIDSTAWLQAARPLPAWTLVATGVTLHALWRRRGEADVATEAARAALCLFALLLLPRVVLNARLYHYGFTLAAPATLVVCAALLDWIPRAVDRRGGAGAVVRAGGLAALAVATVFHLVQSHARMYGKAYAVGEGRDRMYANARGPYVTAALDGIRRLLPAEATLTVLPEGAMINYLARRRSAIPYLTMLPSEVALHGEDELLASLQRNPPDAIALVHRDTSEMGPRLFGRDYARRVAAWIESRYAPAGFAGDPPNEPGSTFGIRLLRRRD